MGDGSDHVQNRPLCCLTYIFQYCRICTDVEYSRNGRTVWYYKFLNEVKEMKRILSVLLMTALLLSMLTGVAFASRQSDAGEYLVDFLVKNGEERPNFGNFMYRYELPSAVDQALSSTGSIVYYPNLKKISVESFASMCSINMDISEDGIIRDCYLISWSTQELIPLQPSTVRADTKLAFTTFNGSAEDREKAESYLSVAFHRGLANLNNILKLGGYSLADLGFTSYTPHASVCYYLQQCPGKKFTDMPVGGTWAHDPIDWAIKENITTGTSATTFQPNMDCSRGQIVTFLWRAAGSPKAAESAHPFTDVTPGAYYYDAMLWAVEQGITSGTSANTFSPDRVCSRSEVVTFLWRANGKPAPEYEDNRFQDVEEGSFYEDAVKWAVSMNITQGTSDTTFAPAQGCSRAQVVTFLYRNDLFS